VVKRGIGVGLILLSTPPAVLIAFCGGCFAARVGSGLSSALVAFVAPLLTLLGLMVWAAVLDHRRRDDPNSRTTRAGIFLATPLIVAIAMAVGVGLAWLIVDLTSRAAGGLNETGVWTGLVVFGLVSGSALLIMLGLAWRAGN
jgi:hypothetical protein